MVLAFGLPVSVIGVALAALLFGTALTTINLIWTNLLQELVPRAMLGRVSAIDQLGSYALIPFGQGVAGWVTDQVGAPTVFLVGGAVTAALGALGLAVPAIRNLD